MKLEDIIEKIKRLDNGGNGTNIVCFIIAFDLLYFMKDNDQRERFIHEYYKNDNGMFTANFKKICFYCESILIQDEIYNNMLKSIEMDIKRDELVDSYNYYDAIERIEKANNSTKNMITDSFKIRLLKERFDKSNKDYQLLNERVAELKTRYDKNIIDIVTIISLFVAISIGMVSGISFTLESFSNILKANIIDVCIITSVTGFILINFFYIILRFISKISGKDLDKNNYFIFVDVILIILIAFFILLLNK